MNSKTPKPAKFDRAVGVAQQLHKMASINPSAGSAKKSHETPALSKMVKLGTAISKKMTPAASTGKFDRAVGVAQKIHGMISSSKPGNAKNGYETPALSRMVKIGSAISRKMGIPDAQGSGGGHAEGGEHRPSKEQTMDFANQLLKMPRPGQGGGNILKETMQYGKNVQALSQSLRTPPDGQSGARGGAKSDPGNSPNKSATSAAHPFKPMGKETAEQRQQTIKQTMQGAEHPMHKVLDMLGELSQGKIEHAGLRSHFTAIGAQLPPKGGGHGGSGGAGGFGNLPDVNPKGWQKQVQGFAEMGSSNNAAMIMAAHQAMSSKINEKLKSAQKPASKPQGK
jgi:hypothetical protein